MITKLKQSGVQLARLLAIAGLLTLTGSSMVSAQTAMPLASGTTPSTEMGTLVAPHAQTIYTLVPQIGTQLANDYSFLTPVTPAHAGFLYKVIGYNFDTLADTRYESSVVNASLKTNLTSNKQRQGLQAAAAAGATLLANEYTVPVPSRVPVMNDTMHNTTYYERDDSVVVVKVENGNVSITGDTRQGLWTSAGMTTSFVGQLIGGTQPMAHAKGDKTSTWWQDAARHGKTLVFSRPVFSGVATHQEADMFIGTSQKTGRNYHFVQQDGQWKLDGSGQDHVFWHQ